MLRYFRQRRITISFFMAILAISISLLWILRSQAQTTYQILVDSDLDGSLAALAGNGTCELREAITIVNSGNDATSDCAFVPAGTPDLTLDDFAIRFDTGGAIPLNTVIQLIAPLPTITSTLDIGGFDVPSALNSVTIEPAPGLMFAAGLRFAVNPLNPAINADNSSVFGMIIRGFGIGIEVNNVGGMQIGRTVVTATDLQNYIYSNTYGILVFGTRADGTLIGNNFIGVDEFNAAMGNTLDGIVVRNGALNTLIGGSIGLTPFGNTISDNGRIGVSVADADTIIISNNLVGLQTAGSLVDFGNGGTGISVVNTIKATVSGNTVGFNGLHGILINGSPNTSLVFNSVGVLPTVNSDIGNTLGGIGINASSGTTIVGGTGAGQFTRVAFNGSTGISIGNSQGVSIEDTIIFDNGGLGIDLNANGVTLNDGVGDADAGANGNQNFPLISAAGTDGATLIMNGLLPTSGANYDLVFYVNSTCDPTTYGEGQDFLNDGGAPFVLNTAPGPFSATLTGAYTVGDFITVIAINRDAATFGNTSEFSQCFAITDATLDASFLPMTATVAPGTVMLFVNTSTGAITDTRWFVDGVQINTTYNFSYQFAAPGTYTVRLEIENSAFPGVFDFAEGIITVLAPTAVPPTAVPPTAVPPTAVPPTVVPPTIVVGVPTATFTAIPPTATFTAIPPTATNIPPTATNIPPTATFTAIPPTATNIPPTATFTAIPPTATNIPPTATFTAIPPTATLIPTVTATGTGTPELQVTVVGDGDDTVSIDVVNTGPNDANGVVIQNQLRGNVRYQAASPGEPICTEVGGIVTCRLGTVGAGDTEGVDIVVSTGGEAPDSGVTIVFADGVAPQIIDEPYISKIGSPPVAPPGSEITYTIRVINPTTETASDMVIRDTMPDIIEILDAEATAGDLEIDGQDITLTLDELAPSERVIITIIARVSDDDDIVDSIINTACVSSSSNVGRDCATMSFLAVGGLPETGQVSWMTMLLRWAGVIGLSGIMLAGIGLLYWRLRRSRL